MIAYSKSWGEEVTGKSGSDPFSAWQYRVIKTWLNSEDMGLTFNNTLTGLSQTLIIQLSTQNS